MIESTLLEMIPAVVAFDDCHVYVKLESRDAGQPSLWNRVIIVDQILPLELKPCTNRIGVFGGGAGGGFLAASALGDDGSVIDPHAPRNVSASTANGRTVGGRVRRM